jgi:DNA-binding transcriptional LysR family regulator
MALGKMLRQERQVEIIVRVERTINFDGVTAFLAVHETQSFTKAATRLGIAKSAVSRRVSELEESLGVRLIHRTTRKLHLTDAGTAYAAHVGRAVAALTDANEAVRDLGDSAKGPIRITAPVDLGSTFLPDTLRRFREKYPEISVDCVLAGRRVDLVAEGVDLALRFGQLQDSSLVARKLAQGSSFFVASKKYLEKRGTPKKLADLATHEMVVHRPTQSNTRLDVEGPKGPESVDINPMLSADDLSFVRRAVVDHAGIALLPWFLVAPDVDSGELVHVLPRYKRRGGDGHLVYPSARLLPKRVSLLIDHLLDELKMLRAEPKV